MAALKELRLDAARTLVNGMLDLKSFSPSEKEPRSALKAFLNETDVFTLLPTGFGSLIYQLALLVLLLYYIIWST